MEKVSIGFIGAGRVTAFMIEGLLRSKANAVISVMDANPEVSAALARGNPAVTDRGADYVAIGKSDIVFLALPVPSMQAGCESVAPFLGKGTVVVSLAPKPGIASLARWTGTDRIARYLPNAATSVGKGYNPAVWGAALSAADKSRLTELLSPLGDMPETDDSLVEAYAVLSAMGPTYLWPLFDELIQAGTRYGIGADEAARLVSRMASACAEMIETTGKDYATRMNMIPAKPMADVEGDLRAAFRSKTDAIYAKLKA